MIIETLFNKLEHKISDTDLLWGLLGGLLWGLLGGLLVGLGGVIGTGLASLINHYPNLLPLWIVIIMVLVVLEIYFWLDKSRPSKKTNKFAFTIGKKFEALIESLATLGVINLIRISYNKFINFQDWNEVLKWTGYIGAGILGLAVLIGVLYLYIKLNSLKYRGKK